MERADGSAQVDVENTKVITAVHGPLVVGGKREHPERAVVEVIVKPCSGIAGVPRSLSSSTCPCECLPADRRLCGSPVRAEECMFSVGPAEDGTLFAMQAAFINYEVAQADPVGLFFNGLSRVFT